MGAAVGGLAGKALGGWVGGLFGGDQPAVDPQTLAQIQADQAAGRGLSAEFLNAYNNAGRAGAPTMGAATVAPVTQALTPVVGATRVGAAPTMTAATQAPAAQVAQTVVAPAQQVTGVQLGPAAMQGRTAVGPAATVDPNSVRLGPAQVAGAALTGPAATADATKVDTTRGDQFRAGQLGLVSNLQGVVNGTAPSVAQEQLKRATADAIAQAQGNAVAASRGGNTALAMRELIRRQGAAQQDLAGQAALVRAQEAATARGQMGDVLNAGRTTDTGIATTDANNATSTAVANAQMKNQLAQTNAQVGTQANIASMQALNAQATRDAELRLQAEQGNQQAKNAITSQQGALDAAQSGANAAALNARDTQQAAMDLQAREASANAVNQAAAQQATINANAAGQNAAATNTVAGNNAGYQQQAAQQNAANQLSIVQLAAQIEQARQQQQAALTSTANLANAQAGNTAALANAGYQQQAAANNQQAAVTTNAQNIQDRTAAGSLALGGQEQVNKGDIDLAKIQQTGQAANAAQDAATTNTVMQVANIAGQYYGSGGGGSGYTAGSSTAPTSGDDVFRPPTSDARAKKKIAAAGDRPFAELLSAIRPASYEYREPGEPGSGTAPGRRFGVLAQDLERGGPAGRSLVYDDGGTKKIDAPQAIGVVMAMSKHLDKRLARLEARR